MKKDGKSDPKTSDVLKQIGSMFELQDKNKFLDCYYKLLDVCKNGLPITHSGSKLGKLFYEKVDLLAEAIRGTRQKSSITEATMTFLSTPSETYSPETAVWTLCLALVLQYPHRELRWSTVEMTTMLRNASRLKNSVLPALSWEEREDVDQRQGYAMCWCHSVLLYVLRSMTLFAISRGLENDEEVWKLCELNMGSEAAGQTIHYLLKKQKCLYRGLVQGCHKAKVSLLPRPLISVLRSFVSPSDDSGLTAIRTASKRHVIERSFDNHCVFETDLDTTTPAKRGRVDTGSETSCKELMTLMRKEVTVETLEESRLLTYLQSLNKLLDRSQILNADERKEVKCKVTSICRSTSVLCARFPLNGQLYLSILRLWLFLARRKQLLSEIPNGHMYFTLLFAPPYEEMSMDLFVTCATSLSSFLLLYLSVCRTRILSSPAVFLEVIRAALAEVMRRADNVNVKPKVNDVSALCSVVVAFNNLLMRLCETEHQAEISRMVRLLVEDYFIRMQTITLHPDVKRVILQIIHLLLEVIDPYCLEQLKLDLKLGPRELLKRVLTDFRAFHNKQGMK